MRGHVDEVCATQNRMSGGSSDSDVNELAAMPTGSSSSIAVMIVTPVAKWPRTVAELLVVGNQQVFGHVGSLGRIQRRCQRGRSSWRMAVGRREHLGAVDPRRELARVAQDGVEALVAVRRAVVEQRELTRAGFLGHVDRVLDRAVTPRALDLVLLGGVLRVVDEEVDAVAELEHVARARSRRRLRRRCPARGRRGTRPTRPSISTRKPSVGSVWRTQRERTLAPLRAKSSLATDSNATSPRSSSGVIGKNGGLITWRNTVASGPSSW